MREVLAALAPSLFVALLFWWVIRSMLNGDRHEREALARLDAQEAQRPGPSQHRAPDHDTDPDTDSGPEASDAGEPGTDHAPSPGEQDPTGPRLGPGTGAGGTGGVR